MKSFPKIVIVNDEQFFLELMEMMIPLWFKTATILTFTDPAKALEELARENPDLLITGVQMPKIDGGYIVQRLSEKEVTYPIIVTSGLPDDAQWVQEYANKGLRVDYLFVGSPPEDWQRLLFAGLGQKAEP